MIDIQDQFDYHWKPNSRPQETFCSLPDSIFECLYGGALGGGKTEVLLHLPLIRETAEGKRWIEYPEFQAIYFRESFPELNKSLIKRAQEFYPKFGGRYNSQEHVFTFPSGAKIWFDYLDTPEKAHKHDTDEYNLIVWEELTAFPEYPYLYMTSRCRTRNKYLPSIIRSAANPGGIGHNWVRKRFVDACPTGYKLINFKDKKRIFIPAKAEDNPDLLRNDPDYINRLQLLPKAVREAKIAGNWYIIAGQAFDEFRALKYDEEPANALHVIDPVNIPFWWPKIVSIDWGYDHPTSIHWHAISPKKRILTYREHVIRHQKISQWASDAYRMSQFDGNIIDVVLDPSAWGHRGEEKSIAEQIQDHFEGYVITRADNNRISGKMNMHEFLRWEQLPDRFVPAEGYDEAVASRIFRLYGEERKDQYKKLFEPQLPEDNLPKWQIFKTCPKIIELIPTLVHDEDNPEDVKKVDGDDPYDDCRYGLMRVNQYLQSAIKEGEKRDELASIIQNLHETGDMNSYYIHMQRYERGNKVVPIRLFHKGNNLRSARIC